MPLSSPPANSVADALVLGRMNDIALGREVKNPWGLVWSLVPDHLEAAKEFNFRIAHGAYPDDPVSYVWDSDNAVLRANKRREEFLRWMDANEGKAG